MSHLNRAIEGVEIEGFESSGSFHEAVAGQVVTSLRRWWSDPYCTRGAQAFQRPEACHSYCTVRFSGGETLFSNFFEPHLHFHSSPSSTILLVSLLAYSLLHVNDVSVYLESSKVMRVISDPVTSQNVSQHEVPWTHRDDYLPATSLSLPYCVGVMRAWVPLSWVKP
jgi:hypothetical protein